MLTPALISEVEAAIVKADGGTFRISEYDAVSGGCISHNFRIGNGRRNRALPQLLPPAKPNG